MPLTYLTLKTHVDDNYDDDDDPEKTQQLNISGLGHRQRWSDVSVASALSALT